MITAALKEVGEDLGMKLLQLEEKTNRLEASVSKISKETASVLTDIRSVLSELENPMNYLKGLGIDEVMLTMAENITEKKLKEFMEKRLEGLVRTVVEGRLKEILESMIMKYVQEQSGPLIEAKVKEMKEKGILKVPIDVDELRKALDEKLNETIGSGELTPHFEKIVKDLLERDVQNIIETRLKENVDSLKSVMLEEVMKGLADQKLIDQISKAKIKASTQKDGATDRADAQLGTSIVGIAACASALMHIFGRRGAERTIEEYYRMGWFSDDLKSSLLRALSVINSKDIPDVREASDYEHLIVTYLFEKLMRGAPDTDFLITLGMLRSGNGGVGECRVQ